MPKPDASGDPEVRDQAVHWLARIRAGDCTEAERRALDEWLARDERHLAEYRKIEDWLSDARQSAPAVFPELQAARQYRPKSRPPLAIAASLVLLLAGGLWAFNVSQPGDVYRTAKGERESIILSDGSRLVLNTDTELEVKYSWRSRTVRLRRGEALFTVAEAERKPFEVVAAGGVIRDLGTSFNVHQQAGTVSVVVLEGSVGVSTRGRKSMTQLTAGERIVYNASGAYSPVEHVDVEATVAWNTGRFVFKRTPLRDVVAQIARYHDVAIDVSDPRLIGLDVSGTFRIADLDGLMAALEMLLPVRFDEMRQGDLRVYRAWYQGNRIAG